MPYRAGPGSGMFGSYAYPDTRPKIDVGGAIDAAVNGASSLIHGAYLRRIAQANMELAQREQAGREKQLAFEEQRETREAANQDREFGLKQQSERHRFIEAGGIPASTTFDTTPNTTDISSGFKPNLPTSLAPTPAPNDGQSPIARAMNTGIPQSVTPPAPAPAPKSRVTETPESFDPTRGAAYERGVGVQQLRNEGYLTRDEARQEFQTAQQQARLDAQQRGREYMAGQALTRLKTSLAARGANGKGGAAMTGGQAELARQRAATGLLDQMGGSYDAAVVALNGADGEAFRKLGVEARHLMYAHSQYVNTATSRALRLQSGLNAMTPEESKAKIDSTRKLVGGTQPPAAGATQTPGARGSAAPPPRQVKKPAPNTPATKPPAGGRPSGSTPKNDFTDDELADGFTALKTQLGRRPTEKEISDYVMKQRRKKAGTA